MEEEGYESLKVVVRSRAAERGPKYRLVLSFDAFLPTSKAHTGILQGVREVSRRPSMRLQPLRSRLKIALAARMT